MATRNLPLSVDSVRQLTRDLKEFSRALKDDVKVDIEQQVCLGIADDIKLGLGAIADVDGNYLSDGVAVEVGLYGHDVIWRGKQILFLEYGTGAAAGAYPGVMWGGYHPDPTKTRWVYMDANSGTPEVSHGIHFQGVMYNAARAAQSEGLAPAKVVLREALNALAL